MEQTFTTIADVILHLDVYLPAIMADYGNYIYAILFLVVFCETGLVVTPFLPGDSLLFACGALAAASPDGMNIVTVMVIFIVASVLGDACNYEIGKHVGMNLVKITHGFVKQEHITKAETFYAKHGHKAIFLARFVPIVRTFAPFVAGIGQMSYMIFAKYNVIGALVWVWLFVGGGYFFGNLPFVKQNFSLITLGIIVVSLIPVVVEFIKNRK